MGVKNIKTKIQFLKTFENKILVLIMSNSYLKELAWLPVPVPEVPEAVVAPGMSMNRDLCLEWWWLDPDPVVDTEELLPVNKEGGRQPTE